MNADTRLEQNAKGLNMAEALYNALKMTGADDDALEAVRQGADDIAEIRLSLLGAS